MQQHFFIVAHSVVVLPFSHSFCCFLMLHCPWQQAAVWPGPSVSQKQHACNPYLQVAYDAEHKRLDFTDLDIRLVCGRDFELAWSM